VRSLPRRVRARPAGEGARAPGLRLRAGAGHPPEPDPDPHHGHRHLRHGGGAAPARAGLTPGTTEGPVRTKCGPALLVCCRERSGVGLAPVVGALLLAVATLACTLAHTCLPGVVV